MRRRRCRTVVCLMPLPGTAAQHSNHAADRCVLPPAYGALRSGSRECRIARVPAPPIRGVHTPPVRHEVAQA